MVEQIDEDVVKYMLTDLIPLPNLSSLSRRRTEDLVDARTLAVTGSQAAFQ
jgi:hypothetical protein